MLTTTPSNATPTVDDSKLDTALRADHLRELKHFASAPVQFFEAWKRGVELAGTHLFGKEPRADLDRATSVKDLAPKVDLINRAIGPMSAGEKVFLAALVSFYDTQDGRRLLQRVGVNGLADLGGLDLKRRAVIAALVLSYTGW